MPKLPHRIIWAFGLGYFVFYAPYSGLTKALTLGLFPGVPAGVTGLEIAPATIAGTIVASTLLLTILGWWRHLPGITAPVVVSALGTALIIGCTTLAYTFEGVSIVLALLLMRGGVLILAPLMDLLFVRKVRWFSWLALVVALAALAISLAAVNDYQLGRGAAINLALYLLGYLLRLTCMTRCAKVEDPWRTRRYFVQELVLALGFLVLFCGVLSFFLQPLRAGFTLWVLHPNAIGPALLIGALYSCLFVFGTLIYLDRRENTFCVAVNRGSSVLAGVLAAYVIASMYGAEAPPPAQLAGSALVVLALLLLSPFHHVLEAAWAWGAAAVRPVSKPAIPSEAESPREM
jgi:hypothetical protein